MPRRVLVVDDDPQLRRALARVLRSFDLVLVETAADALRSLGGGAFDAILTDYGLRPMDGVTLLGNVAVTCPGMRRYLMSGFDLARFDAQVRSGLVHRVFSKPLDLDGLRLELANGAG